MADLGVLILRLGLGIMFFAHGLQIGLGKFGGPGPEGFSKFLTGMGFAPALFWAYLAGYSILIGGALLISGICVRLACIPLIIFILVTFKVHLAKGFFITNGGYEYNFVILMGLIALMLLGSGKFSIFNKF